MTSPVTTLLLSATLAVSALRAQPDVADEAPAAPAAAAATVPDFTLVDTSLRAIPIRIVSLGGITLTFVDEQGATRTITTDEIVALAPIGWIGGGASLPALAADGEGAETDAIPDDADGEAEVETPRKAVVKPLISEWILELADHQRFPGKPAAAQPEGTDALNWEHPLLGKLAFPIDSTLAIWNHRSKRPAPAPAGDDSVLLANGDLLRGLVESIGALVQITPSGASQPIDLPWDRVAAITLANESAPPGGNTVWLTDSTSTRVAGFSLQSSSLALQIPRLGPGVATTGTHDVTIPAAYFAAALFDADQTTTLASMPVDFQKSADDARLRQIIVGDPATPLLAAPIELPGPMTVHWNLPPGVSRLAGWIRLPDDCLDWGDCEIAFSLAATARPGALPEPTPLGSYRINAESPRIRIDFEFAAPSPASPSTLIVTLSQGERGPIQDRAILEHVLLRVDEPAR